MSDKKNKPEDLAKKIKELEKKVNENLNGWQRAKADYENLEKDAQKKQMETSIHVKKELINSLLPVLNSFCQAFKNVPDEKKDDQWVKGFEFIKKQFEDILSSWGIEAIKSVGEQFDPDLHEAVGQEEAEEKSGIIIKEVMPGYKLNGEAIVFTKVIVAK